MRRIVVANAHCAARIDLEREDHVAWLGRRWVGGETQRSIGKSIGFKGKGGAQVCVAFVTFILNWVPESVVTDRWGRTGVQQYREGRQTLMKEALKRFYKDKMRRHWK